MHVALDSAGLSRVVRSRNNKRRRTKRHGRPSVASAQHLRKYGSRRVDKEILDRERPKTRGDCQGAGRPCPWIGCRYHLAGDVSAADSLVLRFSGVAPWKVVETCALDVADRGEHTLEEVGGFLNVTRERARQIEKDAFDKLRPFFERLVQ